MEAAGVKGRQQDGRLPGETRRRPPLQLPPEWQAWGAATRRAQENGGVALLTAEQEVREQTAARVC